MVSGENSTSWHKKGYEDSTVADSAKPEKSFSYSALGWCFQMSGVQKPCWACWLNRSGIMLTNITWVINDDYRGWYQPRFGDDHNPWMGKSILNDPSCNIWVPADGRLILLFENKKTKGGSSAQMMSDERPHPQLISITFNYSTIFPINVDAVLLSLGPRRFNDHSCGFKISHIAWLRGWGVQCSGRTFRWLGRPRGFIHPVLTYQSCTV
jgi:hypothetical protein